MKSQLFIPDKIKVGYQERADTYTKKLAFVIYYDSKGVLRKETSWRGWIDKGNPTGQHHVSGTGWVTSPEYIRPPLDTHDFDNIPTEGFVLNKKAGGYSSGWNHRQTYSRVFDPRGFEFEITIPNLLFILQECNCMKGKGLEGEFVYAWEGKDLVLLPAHCEEYKQSKGYTNLQSKKISVNDLKEGCSYKTKKEENLIYLGKFNWYEFKWDKTYKEKNLSNKKEFIFINERNSLIHLSGLTSLATQNSDIPVNNYAELMDIFTNSKHSNPPVSIKKKLIEKLKLEEFDLYNSLNNRHLYLEQKENNFINVSICKEHSYNYKTFLYDSIYFQITKNHTVSFTNTLVLQTERERDFMKINNIEELSTIQLYNLFVVLKNGEEIKLDKY